MVIKYIINSVFYWFLERDLKTLVETDKYNILFNKSIL